MKFNDRVQSASMTQFMVTLYITVGLGIVVTLGIKRFT